MKLYLRLTTLLLAIVFCRNIQAQTYTGSLTLTSQAQVDAFNYTSVTGDLIINPITPTDITNLDGLSELTSVRLSLKIGNTSLSNLSGLSNLVSIGSDLWIYSNPLLSNITGLSNLSSIGANLYMDNNGLVNLNGLSKIRSLDNLTLTRNFLSNIDGLMNLTAVIHTVDINLNGGLKNLNGLANLNYVGGTFSLRSNTQLTDFCGLYTCLSNHGFHDAITAFGNGAVLNICNTLTGNLTLTTQEQVDKCNFVSITGNLLVQEALDGSITNLGGLSDLSSLGGSLNVQNNTALSSFCGLYNLFHDGYAGAYTVSGNLSNPTSAQITSAGDCPVFTGDITLTTQAEVDAFHYTGVTGSLTIFETTPGTITNLNSLSQLTFVGNNFLFQRNTAISNLNAMSYLSTVGGSLTILESSLTNITGLSHLNSVGRLEISGDGLLTNVDGLSNLSIVNGAMSIYGNTAITNLNGLSRLTSAQDIEISSNPALTDISGLSNLRTIDGWSSVPEIGIGLLITDDDALTNLNGLSGLTSIDGSLQIERNNSLANIDALQNLKTVTKQISIYSNPSLQNIDGLSNVQSYSPDHGMNSIGISDNAALQNINGLRSVQLVWQTLAITSNPLLANIDGVSHLNQAKSIKIQGNDALTNLNGLSNATADTLNVTLNSLLSSYCGVYKMVNQPGTTVSITSNLINPTVSQIISAGACSVIPPDFVLTSQAEVDAFNYSYVPGNLYIGEEVAGNITNLNTLSNLTVIAGSLTIRNNSALTNLDGLSNLSSIPGTLNVEGNRALVNLNGLSHLTAVDGNLSITDNGALISISGLSGIKKITALEISGNNTLADLDGLQNISTAENFVVENNNALTSLRGLSGLSSVKTYFGILNNAALLNVDGLSALNFVGAIPNPALPDLPSLDLRYNAALTNLDGLSHLHTVEGNLLVANNSVLSSFCGLYTLLSTNGLGGSYRASGNASNPTVEEIINGGACTSSVSPVTVTINQATTQSDPTSVSPIHFTAIFSENVTGFDGSDISFARSTANGTLTANAIGGPAIYDVSVSGMTSGGTVVASVLAGAAVNGSSQANLASTSTDNTVNYVLNHCPTATALTLATSVGTSANIQLQGSDADNDALTYSISQNPLHGTVSTSSSGAATYTPAAGYYGTDQFKYKVSDGTCDAEATVDITIVVCPSGQGYWKNNTSSWPVSSLMLGTNSYTQSQLITILNTPVGNGNKADASLILSDQLIAAKLSLANGSPVVDHLSDSIAAADLLIGNSLIPMKVKPNSALGKKMTSLAAFLSDYNGRAMTTGCTTAPALALRTQEKINESDVEGFALEQNRPNPFGEETIITYQLPTTSHVSLKIYDALGREVMTVVNETQTAGVKTVRVNSAHLSTGVYYYRLDAGEFSEAKKMILAK